MARNYVTTVAMHADTHVFRARGINGHGASLINTPPLAVTTRLHRTEPPTLFFLCSCYSCAVIYTRWAGNHVQTKVYYFIIRVNVSRMIIFRGRREKSIGKIYNCRPLLFYILIFYISIKYTEIEISTFIVRRLSR